MCRASDDYIAVMDVLEASVTDMTPADVVAALAAGGTPCKKLREGTSDWGGCSDIIALRLAADTSKIAVPALMSIVDRHDQRGQCHVFFLPRRRRALLPCVIALP